MGSVAMGEGASFYFDGTTVTPIAYCVYCDRCGSFAIGKTITGKTVRWIAVAALIATLFWYPSRTSALPGAWFACFIPLVLIFSIVGALTLVYRCRRCGNRTISSQNVRGYPEYDRQVLDIPYEATVKYYIDNY